VVAHLATRESQGVSVKHLDSNGRSHILGLVQT